MRVRLPRTVRETILLLIINRTLFIFKKAYLTKLDVPESSHAILEQIMNVANSNDNIDTQLKRRNKTEGVLQLLRTWVICWRDRNVMIREDHVLLYFIRQYISTTLQRWLPFFSFSLYAYCFVECHFVVWPPVSSYLGARRNTYTLPSLISRNFSNSN